MTKQTTKKKTPRTFKPKACVRCDAEFMPTNGVTKYCEGCRAEVRLEQRRKATRKWQLNNPDHWRKSNPKRVLNPRPCGHCGVEYTPTHPHSTLCSSECKIARGCETSAQWRKENPERTRELNRRWRKENPERVRELSSKSYHANPERARAYYQNNRDRLLSRQREWRERNPDYSKRYYRDVVKPKAEAYLSEILEKFSRCASHEEGKALALELLNPNDTAGYAVLGYQALDQLLSFYLED